ncbi:MAG: hypothetical protein CMP86_01200 [Gammaproteobacteria bacterium]|nr:hypothetical protein [Gammaproteobacteria bacterium]
MRRAGNANNPKRESDLFKLWSSGAFAMAMYGLATKRICNYALYGSNWAIVFVRRTSLLKIPFIVVVMIGAGCGWMQRGALEADRKSNSYETAVLPSHQAFLAQAMLEVVTKRYPSVTTKFRFQPVGPLGRSLARRLDQLGYRISNVHDAPALIYTLDGHELHGLHLTVQTDNWRVARLYRGNSAGNLQLLSRQSARGPEGLKDLGSANAKLTERQFTLMPPKNSKAKVTEAKRTAKAPELVQRWAVQVMAGQQIRQLEQLRVQLKASGYRAETLEKRWLGLHAVQIRGLKSRKEAEGVLQIQRAGDFKDAFLVEYEEPGLVGGDQISAAQLPKSTYAQSNASANGIGRPITTGARCDRVEIEAGSLRENVRRLLHQCGYTIGNWRLGADGYVEDWMIQRPYVVVVRDGLSGVLALLKHNYFVEGEVRPFTQTIDFRSAAGAL